ncbi:hypothetical protein Salat_2114400 [Sesamum alatum]|uniref:EF-hand domain-containing protein n=1 Tax=Sesamum alatum TaxID=300844 RepID=A0AAE2CGT0_9LAMI|nr:hypothetical protein Salat_2114400 [Sesamum alatum]
MERLRAIADAHYRASPPAVKALAYDFFKALDADGDGKVSLVEFLEFMKLEGYTRLSSPHFFRDLDRDRNGTLDFWEVLTLYYIIKSGRPLCDCCGILIPGTFFSCVECFDGPGGSYSLCIYCYRSNRSSHNHGGRQQFLDTYTLLETKKRFSSGRGRGERPSEDKKLICMTMDHSHQAGVLRRRRLPSFLQQEL